jgi:hypothetical protein
MMKRYTKEEVEELINAWCKENYGYNIYIDEDEPLINDLKDKF